MLMLLLKSLLLLFALFPILVFSNPIDLKEIDGVFYIKNTNTRFSGEFLSYDDKGLVSKEYFKDGKKKWLRVSIL